MVSRHNKIVCFRKFLEKNGNIWEFKEITIACCLFPFA